MKLWISTLAAFALAATSSGATAAAAADAPPAIANESVSNLTSTDATLEAEVNPQSTERGAWYQFQVAATPAEFPMEFTCPTEGFPAHTSLCLSVPSQPGALPLLWLSPGAEAQSVALDLAAEGMELQPGATYYWRVIAAGSVQTVDTIAWEKPAVHGATMSFETPALVPAIESESVSNLTPTSATLEAEINPGGGETSYEFHLVERRRCEEAVQPCDVLIREIPLPEGQLAASMEGQQISLDLSGVGVNLEPGHDFYEYWVSAANSAGAAEVAAQSFTTPGLPSEEKPEGESAPDPQRAAAPALSPPDVFVARTDRCHRRQLKHRRKHRRGISRRCAAS